MAVFFQPSVFNINLINALRESRKHQETLEKREMELEKALSEIKTLHGILPICSYCRNVRNDEGAWSQLEDYIANHSHTKFSHGICPKCEKIVRKEWGINENKD